jgi:hypothetical protein
MLPPSSLIAAFSSSSSAPSSEIARMLVSAFFATGAGLLQPGNIGMAAATLAASAVRQNWRLCIIGPSFSCIFIVKYSLEDRPFNCNAKA